MKKKYFQKALTFIVTCFLISCHGDAEESKTYRIINSTDYEVVIRFLKNSDDELNYVKYLLPNDVLISTKVVDPGDGQSNYYANSSEQVIVLYNDSIQIQHCIWDSENQASKPINRGESWEFEQLSQYSYQYTYTFTEADYLEALALHDSTLVE